MRHRQPGDLGLGLLFALLPAFAGSVHGRYVMRGDASGRYCRWPPAAFSGSVRDAGLGSRRGVTLTLKDPDQFVSFAGVTPARAGRVSSATAYGEDS